MWNHQILSWKRFLETFSESLHRLTRGAQNLDVKEMFRSKCSGWRRQQCPSLNYLTQCNLSPRTNPANSGISFIFPMWYSKNPHIKEPSITEIISREIYPLLWGVDSPFDQTCSENKEIERCLFSVSKCQKGFLVLHLNLYTRNLLEQRDYRICKLTGWWLSKKEKGKTNSKRQNPGQLKESFSWYQSCYKLLNVMYLYSTPEENRCVNG